MKAVSIGTIILEVARYVQHYLQLPGVRWMPERISCLRRALRVRRRTTVWLTKGDGLRIPKGGDEAIPREKANTRMYSKCTLIIYIYICICRYKWINNCISFRKWQIPNTKTAPSFQVVVMGSSTTSDKTINTSTDSAATALTSVTGTDDSMDAEPDGPELSEPSLIDDPNVPTHPPHPPSTAPPHYHRAQNSCDIDSPAYTKPQSATDVIDSPRPGPGRFVFDVPIPDPKRHEKPRNKTQTQVSQTSVASTSIQIPFDPKMDTPKSPKANQAKYETHFKFEPDPVKRRGSEPRVKNKQKIEKEYYKDEVAKLRRQLEGTEVFTTSRRRSSAHQHSVPPPSSRRQSTGKRGYYLWYFTRCLLSRSHYADAVLKPHKLGRLWLKL